MWRWTKRTVIGCLTCRSNSLMGGPWPMKAAIYSRPSAVSLKVWLRETREHLTRDQRPFLLPESLQILQIHSSMTVLLLFSSEVHSCSTGFRSEDGNGHSRSLVLCPVTHFCVVFEVCVWNIVRLEDPNMAHYKISNRVSHLLIFYLLVFDRIHDAMYLNKMSRTFSRNKGPQH